MEGALQETDSFTAALLSAAWGRQAESSAAAAQQQQQQQQEQLQAFLLEQQQYQQQQQQQADIKALLGGSACDVQPRRDVELQLPAWGALLASSAPYGLPQQPAGGSSGPSSELTGSAQQQQQQEAPAAKPAKRTRGRQRKNTGVETAQQRAHRRFYQRKKERMASLEQEAREKQATYLELQAVNTELKRKLEALERAVAGRDEHITLIQALGSLSIRVGQLRGQPGQMDLTEVEALVEQADLEQQQQEQQAQQQQLLSPGLRTKSSPLQATVQGSLAAQLDELARAGSAPGGPPPELMHEVEAAGPFALTQLPQFDDDDDALPPVPRAGAAAACGDGSQQPDDEQQHEAPSWLQPLQLSEISLREGQQEGAPSMGLMRSLSVPARTDGGAALALAPGGQPAQEPGSAAALARVGSLRAAAAAGAAGEGGWQGFSAAGQGAAAAPTPVPVGTRPRSWSGTAADSSQLQAPMWGTVTTAGPPLASGSAAQQQQQQQWQQAGTGLPHGLPLKQQLLQPPCAFGAAGLPLQPQQQQAQLVQQLQQMGDFAFGGGPQSLQVRGPMAGPGDDLMLLDDDIMELLERVSAQQSFDVSMSPLPSIPSALLAGDSLRQVLAAAEAGGGERAADGAAADGDLDTAAAAAAAAAAALSPAAAAPAGPGGDAAFAPAVAATAAFAGADCPAALPATLLDASRQLQARHKAAGFCPPASSANEMFYVHEMVEWYRTKLAELHLLLPMVDQPAPDVACGVRLIQVMEDVIEGTRKFNARNRIGMWELKLINLETGAFDEPPPAHWRTVADRIQLPAGMRESALACYTLYLEYVDRVRAERVAVLQDFLGLQAQLDAAASRAAAAAQHQQQPQHGAPLSLQFRADGYEEYHALLDRLTLSLKREHMVANMLSYSLAQIASHVQMAKGMLACWPYWPDGPSVLSIWLQDDQQLQALGGAYAAAAATHARGPSM